MGDRMSSKKKTNGKNNKNNRSNPKRNKQTVVHFSRNLAILCIIAVLFGIIAYRSLNIYSQEKILEYPAEQSVTGYSVAETNYTIADANEHYIEYTFEERNVRVFWINMNAEAPVDNHFEIDTFLDDQKVEHITTGVGQGQYAEKTYLNHKPINRIRFSTDQDISLESVYIEHLQEASLAQKRTLQKQILVLIVVMLLISCWLAKKEKLENIINNSINGLKGAGEYVKQHPKQLGLSALLYVLAGVCGWLLRNIYFIVIRHGTWQWTTRSTIYGVVLGLLGYEIIKYLFIVKKRTFEVLFLRCGVILCVGLTLLLPMRLNVSWDDQTHFINAAGASHLQNSTLSIAEEDFYYTCYLGQLKSYSMTEEPRLRQILNDPSARVAESSDQPVLINFRTVIYLPAILVFFFARGLGIPMTAMVVLGRLASALFYLIVIYLGMRHLKSGKMIMAAVALMPGAVFLVSNFNYDYWLIALVAYSIAYLIGEYQHPEKLLTVKDIVLIFGTFLVGILAKPVYIPLLGLAAFLPKEKFKSVKWRRIYRCFFCGIVVLAVLGFAVLIFGGGLGSGDMRGGEGVNAAEQIQYILSDPMKYTGLLLSYLRFQYLNMTMFKAFIVQTAYYWSIPALAMPCLIWLVVVTVLDRRRNDVRPVGCPIKITVLPLAFASVCCVATAMYVTFNEVGAATIEGCQGRYLWPIMAPLFLTLGQIRFLTIPRNDKVERWIEGVGMVISVILAACMLTEFL